MKKIYLPLSLFLLFSCNKNKSQIIKQKNHLEITQNKAIPVNMKPNYIIYDTVKNLPFNEVVRIYKPDKEENFVFGYGHGNINEFRTELLNIFTEQEIKSGKIILKEVTWRTNDKENLTIWYQEKNKLWQPVYHHIWNKEAEF